MAEAQKVATSEAKPIAVGMEYVTIPEKNVLGWEHPSIGINFQKWAAGTHLVPAEVAGEINRRVKRHYDDCVRILNNKVDPMAIRKQNTMAS